MGNGMAGRQKETTKTPGHKRGGGAKRQIVERRRARTGGRIPRREAGPARPETLKKRSGFKGSEMPSSAVSTRTSCYEQSSWAEEDRFRQGGNKGLIPLLKQEHDVLVKRAQKPFLALFNLLLLLMLPGGTMLWTRPRRLRSGMPRQRMKGRKRTKAQIRAEIRRRNPLSNKKALFRKKRL